MSSLTKLEEMASRMMAGMMAHDWWHRDTFERMAEDARLAAQALLAECAKHEPEPMKYGPSFFLPKFPNPLDTADKPTTEECSVVHESADTWLVRVPTDPIPETCSEVRFGDGSERKTATGPWILSLHAFWRHATDHLREHITHYKP